MLLNYHLGRFVLVSLCVGDLVRLDLSSLQHGYYSKPTAPNLQHTAKQEQSYRCGNSSTQSQAPDDGYINVRNMLST